VTWGGGGGRYEVAPCDRSKGGWATAWSVGERAPADDQDPIAVAKGGTGHEQGTRAQRGVRWGALSWAGPVGEGSGPDPTE
jgi:hypothetical protein